MTANKPIFVYVSYIASSPDKVFKALTDTEATAKFWFGNAVTSDWKVGSPVTFHREGKLIIQGEVLEYDPPRRLSHCFKPMHDEKFSAEQPSRVVYEIEQQRDQVKLTVTHDDFAPGHQGVRQHQQRLAAGALQPQELPGDKPRPARAVVRQAGSRRIVTDVA